MADKNNPLSCSFCGKSQREVKAIVAGPCVYICDECIGLCTDIIETHADELDYEPPRFAEVRSNTTLQVSRRRSMRQERRHESGPPRWLP